VGLCHAVELLSAEQHVVGCAVGAVAHEAWLSRGLQQAFGAEEGGGVEWLDGCLMRQELPLAVSLEGLVWRTHEASRQVGLEACAARVFNVVCVLLHHVHADNQVLREYEARASGMRSHELADAGAYEHVVMVAVAPCAS